MRSLDRDDLSGVASEGTDQTSPRSASPLRSRRRRRLAGLAEAAAETRRFWSTHTLYQKFEHLIALVLTFFIALVIISATWHLALSLPELIFAIDPGDYAAFQRIFGMVMTVLIALEFKHSIITLFERKRSIVQVRTIVLIALLVLVRKFIVLDIRSATPGMLLGLAAAVLALGAVYWLVREQDRREAAAGD